MRTKQKILLALALVCFAGKIQAELLPEEKLFDSIAGATPSNALASWRDARVSPPLGAVAGVLITTNTPFELTRLEVLVALEGETNIANTVIEAIIFRGTNQLAHGLLDEPAFECGTLLDGIETNVVTLTPQSGGLWLATVTMTPYGWGTTRALSLRSRPFFEGDFAKLSIVGSSNTLPGTVTYSGDGFGALSAQSITPAIRVWRRVVKPEAPLTFEQFFTDLRFSLRPGYQLGCATNLAGPWEWVTDETKIGYMTASTEAARQGFFKTRPDATP